MHWQEPPSENEYEDANVVDIAFRIRCPRLPVDHAYDLFRAIVKKLPWIQNDDRVGIHSIHGAESGSGWYRPTQENGGVMQLSNRVRLILRVPKGSLDQCAVLCGRTLTVSDQRIKVNNYKVRPIGPMPTLFARGVLTAAEETEDTFIERVESSLSSMKIDVPKILPGRKHKIRLPDQNLVARSLLLADLSFSDSIKLQEMGLGEKRKLGCGLFIPHKSIS